MKKVRSTSATSTNKISSAKALHRSLTHKVLKKQHPIRDHQGKFTTGHGGLHHHKPFNWGRALPLIAAVSILGGLLVLQSLASGKPVNPKDSSAVVSCAYQTFLNRRPDASGARYWQETYMRSNHDSYKLGAALFTSSEGQRVAKTTTSNSFIKRLYSSCMNRPATDNDLKAWAKFDPTGTKKPTIFNFVVQVGNKPFNPATEGACKEFTKANSSVKPVCKAGSRGSIKDVAVTNVPGSNIYVNKAWLNNVRDLRSAAARAGFTLAANDNSSVVTALKRAFPGGRSPSPGSFRSWDEQNWLWQNPNFSANRPGNSMHEWGLAIDMTCNGVSIIKNQACWQWVRSNGPRYGVHNFHSVRKISNSEAWHFSSNGL